MHNGIRHALHILDCIEPTAVSLGCSYNAAHIRAFTSARPADRLYSAFPDQRATKGITPETIDWFRSDLLKSRALQIVVMVDFLRFSGQENWPQAEAVFARRQRQADTLNYPD